MCEECRRLTTSMRNVIRKIEGSGAKWRAADRIDQDTRLIVADVIQQILNEANQIGEKP